MHMIAAERVAWKSSATQLINRGLAARQIGHSQAFHSFSSPSSPSCPSRLPRATAWVSAPWPRALYTFEAPCRSGGLLGRPLCTSTSGKPSFDGSSEGTDTKRRLEEFKETLREPDDIWISEVEARQKFGLSQQELEELTSFLVKESPFESRGQPFKQYPLKDVVELAKKERGEERLVEYHYRRYLLKGADRELARKLYGQLPSEPHIEKLDPGKKKAARGKHYWYTAPSTGTTEGRKSVEQGLRTNLGICTIKGVVWYFTGSHAIFADWMHSIADVFNYGYRLIVLNWSTQTRDLAHPYGYSPLRYITADRSFVFLGVVGGILPVVSGVSEFVAAYGGHMPLGDHLMAPAAVFLVSMYLEGQAVRAAYQEIHGQVKSERVTLKGDNAEASTDNWLRWYLMEGRDVMSTATFLEASSGVVGAGIGLVGLGASWYLQSAAPDVAASILMAASVCGVSSFLLRRTRLALLGRTLPHSRVKALIARLEAHAAVVNVYDVKTEIVGTDTVRFKAEVQFNPQEITERILRVGPWKERLPDSMGGTSAGYDSRWHLAHAQLTKRLNEILPLLHRGVPPSTRSANEESEAAAWLYRNNGLFYEALALEVKDIERMLRDDLRDFRNVHIDLEPW